MDTNLYISFQNWTMNTLELLDSCSDLPRQTDYQFSELFWAWEETILKFPLDKIHIQNQWLESALKMSCTRQALAHITNGNNLLYQNSQDDNLARRLWIAFCALVPTANISWATLQSSLDQFLGEKLIAWYSRVNTIEEWKAALDSGRFIFTGSNTWDWLSVRDNKTYAIRGDNRLIWHAFCIVGYDDTWFQAINSYGVNNGVFTIPFELFETLFSRYAISDFEDTDAILLFKSLLMDELVKKAIDLGITSGSELERPILRREAILMIMRAFNIVESKFGKK